MAHAHSHCETDQVSPELTTSLRIGLTDSTPVNSNVPATSRSAAKLTSTMHNVGFGGEKEVSDAPASNEEFNPGRAPMFNASVGPGYMSRELLTMRRKLLLKVKDFDIDALEFACIQKNYDKFCEGINSLKKYELKDRRTENVSAQYDKCCKLFQQSELRFNKRYNEQTRLEMSDDDSIDPSDSASQVTKTSLTSNTSSTLRHIELELKKAELSNLEEIGRIRKAKLLAQAEAEEAEALAKLSIERANIEAEEKMLECCS